MPIAADNARFQEISLWAITQPGRQAWAPPGSRGRENSEILKLKNENAVWAQGGRNSISFGVGDGADASSA
jgi:hypothetical protein